MFGVGCGIVGRGLSWVEMGVKVGVKAGRWLLSFRSKAGVKLGV